MKNQVLTTSGWVNLQWEDEFLTWEPSLYGGVEEISVEQRSVWLPDLLVENTAQSFAELGSGTLLVSVKHTGHVSWEPGVLTKTICEVNIGKYPFDVQSCQIKFLTWMLTNKTLDVQPGSRHVSLDACIQNGEWDITDAVAEPYFYPSTYRPDATGEDGRGKGSGKKGTAHTGVTFCISLHRKRTFYVLNTIIPVVMLSLLNVLVFLLPASSGEKMALAVTVLLSFTVYLSIISEVMPKTSESISILAVYLTLLLSLSTLSVLSSGVVMNMIHQDDTRPVPRYLRCLLCCRLRYIRNRLARSQRPRRRWSRRYSERDRSVRNRDHDLLKKRAPPDGAGTATGSGSGAGGEEDHVEEKEKGEVGERAERTPQQHHVLYSHGHVNHGVLGAGAEGRGGGRGVLEKEGGRSSVHEADDPTCDDAWSYVTWLDVGSAVDKLLFWVFLAITLFSTFIVLLLFSY